MPVLVLVLVLEPVPVFGPVPVFVEPRDYGLRLAGPVFEPVPVPAAEIGPVAAPVAAVVLLAPEAAHSGA